MQAPVAMMVLKGNDYIVEIANDTYLQTIDKGKDFTGKPLLESLPDFETQGLKELLDNVMKSGIPFYGNELEVYIHRNNKREQCFFNFGYHPVREQNEMVTGIIVVLNEVTEQVLARRKIETSEQRFRNLVEKAPYPVCILKGVDMVLEVANDQVYKIWNVGKDVLGKPFLEIIPEMKGQPFMGWLLDVYLNGVTLHGYEEQAYFTGENGEKKLLYFNFVYQPYHENDGSVSGVMVLATDVTEQVLSRKKLEESEKHFRLMTDLMPAKISNANAGGDVIYFNQNWLDYTGMNFEELKEFGYHKIIHSDELEEFQQRFQKAAATQTVLEMEMRFLNKEGNYKWHLNLASPVKDENGNIKMWVGVTTEIQEQKEKRDELEKAVIERTSELIQSNEDLKEKNSQFEKINKELEEFSYIASHDLQEPLRKIRTFANRILEKESQDLSDSGKDYFKRIQSAATRMQQLIEDLLSFSRLNMAEGKFETTGLNTIIEEVKAELKETIEEKLATIEVPELCVANIIPFQFRQLMQNLIGNALKFSKPGIPPHIILKSKIADGLQFQNEKSDLASGSLSPEKNYCCITIADNGIGFDPQYKEQIFEVFQRLHGWDEYSGTGIGLSIVKKIVENHNGIILVTSEPGKGTTFDIYIPHTG
jgi:PAS domain S-box-containing protein